MALFDPNQMGWLSQLLSGLPPGQPSGDERYAPIGPGGPQFDPRMLGLAGQGSPAAAGQNASANPYGDPSWNQPIPGGQGPGGIGMQPGGPAPQQPPPASVGYAPGAGPQPAQPGYAQQMPQPQPPPQQQPGLPTTATAQPSGFDRMSAFVHNFGAGNGIIPGLVDAIQGASTGQRTDPRGLQQQSIQATYQALRQSGVPEGVAVAAAYNPEVLKTIAPQLYTKPTLTESGVDPLSGQKSFIWAQPDKMTVSPAVAAGAAPGSPGGAPPNINAMVDGIATARAQGASQDQLLQQVPTQYREYVSSLLAGKAIPGNLGRPGPARAAIMTLAHSVDPSFDETALLRRETFARQMGQSTPNSIGGQRILTNTSLGHLGTVAEKASDLGNVDTWLAPLGQTINAVRGLTTAQQAKVTALNEAADRAAGEIGKLYSGSSGGGVSEREQTRSRFGGSATSASLASALETSRELIHSKIEALQSQYVDAYGPNAPPLKFLNKEGEAALQKIDAAIAKLRGQAAPGGTTQSGISWSIK